MISAIHQLAGGGCVTTYCVRLILDIEFRGPDDRDSFKRSFVDSFPLRQLGGGQTLVGSLKRALRALLVRGHTCQSRPSSLPP